MKYWQLKTKDLEILLIRVFKVQYNQTKSLFLISVLLLCPEVTGIPEATCIRKLEWLAKSKYLRKTQKIKI